MQFQIVDESTYVMDVYSKTVAPDNSGGGPDCWVPDITPGSMCAEGYHSYGQTCTLSPGLWPTPSTITGYTLDWGCIDSFMNSGNGSDTSGTTGTTGGNPDDPNPNGGTDTNQEPDDDFATTIYLDEFDTSHHDNCRELQKLLNVHTDSIPASFKTLKEAIADLKDGLDGATEEGFTFFNSTISTPYMNEVTNTGEGYVNYPNFGNIFGGIHLHVDNTHPDLDNDYEPMFSHQDIKVLLTFTENYNNPNVPAYNSLFVHMLVTYQGTYAIKIKDLTKLQQLNTIYGNKRKRKQFERALDIAYRRKTDDFANPNGTAIDYQKIFLKFVTLEYDLGISIFKTKEDSNGIPIGWEELVIVNGDTANSSIEKKPCN